MERREGISRRKLRRRGEEAWRVLIEAQRASGLSDQGFCKREGLAISSFRRWQARLQEGSRHPAERSGVFVEAFVDPDPLALSERERFEGAACREKTASSSGEVFGKELELRMERKAGRGDVRIGIPRGFDKGTLTRLLEVMESFHGV